MSIITLNEISEYFRIDMENVDDINIFSSLADRITSMANTYCNRIFEADDYVEYHRGKGKNTIYVKNPPINTLSRVAIGSQTVMYVYNTSTYTTAFVTVNSTGIVLTKDGTADSTCTFAAYTTMTTMVDAINAIGSGWVAVLSNTTYANYKSNELLPRHASNALDSNYVYLSIPEEALDEYEVNDDAGIIYTPAKIFGGINSVRVEYNGGWTAANIPNDIRQVALQEVIRWYQEKKTPHLASVASGETTTAYISKNLMPQTRLVFDMYRIRPVGR